MPTPYHSLDCRITISDKKNKEELSEVIKELIDIPIHYSLGGHKSEDLDGIDFIIRNPAVPRNLPIIKKAIEKDIPIYTETALSASRPASSKGRRLSH